MQKANNIVARSGFVSPSFVAVPPANPVPGCVRRVFGEVVAKGTLSPVSGKLVGVRKGTGTEQTPDSRAAGGNGKPSRSDSEQIQYMLRTDPLFGAVAKLVFGKCRGGLASGRVFRRGGGFLPVVGTPDWGHDRNPNLRSTPIWGADGRSDYGRGLVDLYEQITNICGDCIAAEQTPDSPTFRGFVLGRWANAIVAPDRGAKIRTKRRAKGDRVVDGTNSVRSTDRAIDPHDAGISDHVRFLFERATLTDTQRQVLSLTYRGLTPTQIGEVLGVAKTTVATHLSRGMEKVREFAETLPQ